MAFQYRIVANSKGEVGVFNLTSPNWRILKVNEKRVTVLSTTNLRAPRSGRSVHGKRGRKH